jgi:ubiquinol-cytochrome c reductase iron-sulfur subunit
MTTETPKVPDDRELADMSRDELVELGTALDGVEVIHAETRWPVAGTRAEKRAERGVAFWLLLGGLSGLALLVIFLFWPWQYPKDDPNNLFYVLATPLYGLTFGLSILSIGIGAVLYQKRFIPYEIAVQDRHDGPSSEVDRKTIVAELSDTLDKSTIGS